ncbi:DUF423 domain-containing protein [Belliella kenyensis]|uniref:DUF423 domain-containing protein n=1 Tax=Belliella kenyensis TaxID=1472724 RepID=A0ABV8EIQ8_9BACT|nr:DUF423 domain-containing protein [Belliella kenyensis]MCH7400897.1 DUF423 domain-containing protein [Belliella kenyensis]MDN3603897.1 DUF423 domain-containing protein [Belliella kenyensis]
MNNIEIKIAAILGGLGVVIGAFGAHGLAETLATHGRAETFETAVKYHFYHTFAILAVGILKDRYPYSKHLSRAFFLFLTGIFVFSGSLYTLSLTGITWLGAITPFGGIAFILGWIFLLLFTNQTQKTIS